MCSPVDGSMPEIVRISRLAELCWPDERGISAYLNIELPNLNRGKHARKTQAKGSRSIGQVTQAALRYVVTKNNKLIRKPGQANRVSRCDVYMLRS